MRSFPIYLLKLNGARKIVFPEDRLDVGHPTYWRETVSRIVAEFYGIPPRRIQELPYCQSRARIVGHTIYWGFRRKAPEGLLKTIQVALGDAELRAVYDEHERRLRAEVLKFRRFVSEYRQ